MTHQLATVAAADGVNTNRYELIQPMPIPTDEFRTIGPEEPSLDLSADTTQGRIYRFLLSHADRAFRQREIAAGADVPRGSLGPTLGRLESAGLLEHRGHYWAVSDSGHSVAAAAAQAMEAADAADGGFPTDAAERWMETATDPPDGES